MDKFEIINQKKENFQNFILSIIPHYLENSLRIREYYSKLKNVTCDQFMVYIIKTIIPKVNQLGKVRIYLNDIITNELKMVPTQIHPDHYNKFKNYLKLFIYLLE
jgi:hypothetical protein